MNPLATLEMLSSEPAALNIEALHNDAFVQLPLGVAYSTQDGHFIWSNRAFDEMLGLAPDEHKQCTVRDLTHAEDFQPNDELLHDLWQGKINSYALEKRYVKRNGATLWVRVTAAMVRDAAGHAVCAVGFLEDISVRKSIELNLHKTEAEVERIHKELMAASRQAGMAEVATNVLHNVGNVLNSVNVSASMVTDRLKRSKAARLADVAALLEQNTADLASFMTVDERGKQLPAYLATLASQLQAERQSMLDELATLRANLDHIKDAVTMQQTYAKRCGVSETVAVTELVEDSLRMNAGALTRHQVVLEREFITQPQIVTDKHKVLQILVNLIRNAKYACDESGRASKQVTVRVETAGDRVRISVSDNGVGIAPATMSRLFSHGFTTRKSGHGFGLHSAALSATDLGGSLAAHSDGAGCGATFVLELPMTAPERSDD
ncbi:MAG: ATP-binding protein [Pseudomonadota bacterium]